MTTAVASSTDVLVTKENGRLSIVLNRPDVANALTGAQCQQLIELLESASTDPEVRVVTIGATGRHFCAGMDLRAGAAAAAAEPKVGPERYPTRMMTNINSSSQRTINAVLDCMKPVVAIVHGPAAGLGLYLTLASDIVVASKNAAFVEAFLARGMVLHCNGAHLLVARLGMARAKEFVFFGGRLSADEAYQLGLVNRVTEPDDLEATANELVARFAAAPTIAIGLSKRLLNRAVGSDRATALEEEAMAMEINGTSQDAVEGGTAFGERREPSFVGW
jgi:2-(1,2-epoxy-1,2-dihydrophenyl)acetyl-CoA isomerase